MSNFTIDLNISSILAFANTYNAPAREKTHKNAKQAKTGENMPKQAKNMLNMRIFSPKCPSPWRNESSRRNLFHNVFATYFSLKTKPRIAFHLLTSQIISLNLDLTPALIEKQIERERERKLVKLVD